MALTRHGMLSYSRIGFTRVMIMLRLNESYEPSASPAFHGRSPLSLRCKQRMDHAR